MTDALLSLLLSGLMAFSFLCLFFALAPRLAGKPQSILGWLVQWALIFALVLPAVAAAFFGPMWLHEAMFAHTATQQERLWLLISGLVALPLCFVAALRTNVGRRYLLWRAAPAT